MLINVNLYSIMTRLALLFLSICSVGAWVSPLRQSRQSTVTFPASSLSASSNNDASDNLHDSVRRGVLLGSMFTVASLSTPARALVKGNAPPSSMKPMSERPKCSNIDECQAMAERKQLEEEGSLPKGPPPKVTKAGTRYVDLDVGDEGTPSAKDGDDVTLYYKVLKLGKRSYDGLSGEGTVVFSRGKFNVEMIVLE